MDIKDLIKNNKIVLIDVRSDWEYEENHLTNARNIPLEQVALYLPEFRSIENPIVLYCRSGNRSGMAVRLLKQAGIQNVWNGGGLDELKNIMLN